VTKEQVRAVLERGLTWPKEPQEEAKLDGGVYHATPEELQAIDEAERSGLASEEEVEAAFKTFRRR
jgi:hypothetical protein